MPAMPPKTYRNALADRPENFYDQPLAFRSSILPLGTYENQDGSESLGWAWPQMALDAKEAAEIPGRYLSGDPNQAVTPEDAQRTAINAAGMMMGGGLLSHRAPNPAPRFADQSVGHVGLPKNTVSTLAESPQHWPIGEPMRAYHGTAAMKDFSAFDREPWLSDVPDIANAAAFPDLPPWLEGTRSPGAGRVFPVEITPQNPFIVDYADSGDVIKKAADRYGYEWNGQRDAHDMAREKGHDFLFYENTPEDVGVSKLHRQIVPLQPNTVRSATTGEILYSNGSKGGAGVGMGMQSDEDLNDLLSRYGIY